MKTLKTLDFSKEKALLKELKKMRSRLDAKAHELEDLLIPRGAEYYGAESRMAFYEINSHEYTTEDGYSVIVDRYYIKIEKTIDIGLIRGSGTIYDRDFSDLSFYPVYNSGRCGNGLGKKYNSIRERMQEIQRDEIIVDPFKEFIESNLLSNHRINHIV